MIKLYNYALLSFSSSQGLQSVVCLGFQHHLPPFPTASDHCLPILYSHFPIIFNSCSTLSLHLLHGLPPFVVPSNVAVAICLAFIGFAFFQHYHTILVGVTINFTTFAPCNTSFMCMFFPILQHSPSFMGLNIFLMILCLNSVSMFASSVVVVQVSDS